MCWGPSTIALLCSILDSCLQARDTLYVFGAQQLHTSATHIPPSFQ
jgi:hypothetical protein